ncbi:MAG: hypothetical protein KatS3mg068_0763 [Candidatus Sericytochromatia bacterium]|nr:MAG: hypothetical protein KatS3mg068_0763 [Candidatus Sericytochromatia bacterium]
MKKKLIITLFFLTLSCQYQEEILLNNSNNNNSKSQSIKQTPKPILSPTSKPISDDEKDIDPNDKEVVTTDTEVQKTNVDWKIYNPIIKDKKYTYIYTIKSQDSNISTEILREIISVSEKSYKIKQIILSSSKESQLRATELTININSDNSPSIIPVISVSGEKISTSIKTEIIEKPEKIKVPFKEIEAIKIIAKIDDSETINWYGKDIGLVKSIQIKEGITYTLELKDFK